MNLQKVTIALLEKDAKKKEIVEAVLSIYPVEGLIDRDSSDVNYSWTFLIRKNQLNLLRKDIRTLRIVGYRVREMWPY